MPTCALELGSKSPVLPTYPPQMQACAAARQSTTHKGLSTFSLGAPICTLARWPDRALTCCRKACGLPRVLLLLFRLAGLSPADQKGNAVSSRECASAERPEMSSAHDAPGVIRCCIELVRVGGVPTSMYRARAGSSSAPPSSEGGSPAMAPLELRHLSPCEPKGPRWQPNRKRGLQSPTGRGNCKQIDRPEYRASHDYCAAHSARREMPARR